LGLRVELVDLSPLSRLGSASRIAIPQSIAIDGYRLELQGWSGSPDGSPLGLVCVGALNSTTRESIAAVCRSTARMDEAGIREMADHIIREDLPAVRF